jgi:serine/threonine protein kinase
MENLIGQSLGQYRIEAKIGQGGMAVVFKAYQSSLDRYVAIKVLPPSLVEKAPVFIKRFQREAKSIARLHHPNILPVYDFGVEGDYNYIVMRYVEGSQTLSQVIPQALAYQDKVDLVLQVAGAPAYAHKEGIIHRDVKPSNILLDEGWTLLSDFGLAKANETASRLTSTGSHIGTAAYMSPEQAQGGRIDQRTDIYALGIILYELLTGTIPHDASSALGILLKRTTEPPLPPRMINPAIPKRMEQVIIRALAANLDNRYSSTLDFIKGLKEAKAADSTQQPGIKPTVRQTDVLDAIPLELSTPLAEPEILPNPEATAPNYPQVTNSVSQSLALPEKDSYLGKRLWPAIFGLSLTLVALIFWWRGNIFNSTVSQASPAPTITPVAAAPTSTQTAAPAPMPTPTSTATPLPPTETPLPTSTPPDPPSPPTATPLVIIVTATNSPTFTPTSSPTTALALATSTQTPTPIPILPTGTFVLIRPISLDEPSYGLTSFEWSWSGPVPPDTGFEVRVWREDEPQAGAHDAILDNQQGRIEKIGPAQYRLNIDISQAFGVRGRKGAYLWTVALVQVSPLYSDLGQQAEPAQLRFETGGGGSDNNEGNGRPSSGVIR